MPVPDEKDPKEPEVDLSNPAVQAAIAAAKEEERKAAEEREAGLKANRDEILNEKKQWSKFGKPDEIAEKLSKLEDLEARLAAGKIGADPDKFKAEVERQAQAKFEARRAELDGVVTQHKDRAAELEAQVAELSAQVHRAFVTSEFVKATIPEDLKVVQDGAWDYTIDQLASVVEKVEVAPGQHVARFKVNGSLVPSAKDRKTPDGLMDMREFLSTTRQGKGPLSNLAFCFVSAGKGSGTLTPDGPARAAGFPSNWHAFTAEQKVAYKNEFGSDAAIELMDASPKPKEAASG